MNSIYNFMHCIWSNLNCLCGYMNCWVVMCKFINMICRFMHCWFVVSWFLHCLHRHIGMSKHCRQPWSRIHIHKTLLAINKSWKYVNLPSTFQIRQTDGFNCGVIMTLVFWYQALNLQPLSEYCTDSVYGCIPNQDMLAQVRRWFLIILSSNGNVWGSWYNRMEWDHTTQCAEPYQLDLGQNLGLDAGSSQKTGLGYCPPNTRRTPVLAQRPILFPSEPVQKRVISKRAKK